MELTLESDTDHRALTELPPLSESLYPPHLPLSCGKKGFIGVSGHRKNVSKRLDIK